MKRSFLRKYGWAIGSWLLITYLFLMPGDSVPDPGIKIPGLDKVVHSCCFALVIYFLIYGYVREEWSTKRRRKVFFLSAAALAFYGLAVEYLQTMIPRRSADLYDLLADLAGILIGSVAYAINRRCKLIPFFV